MDILDSTRVDVVGRATHDWNGDAPLSQSVADAVAALHDSAGGRDGPTAEHGGDADAFVELDALDELLEPLTEPDPDREVTLAYDGLAVTVAASGDIVVRRIEKRFRGLTDDAFEAALVSLLRTAEDAGVDVEGGWACRDGTPAPDWGIEIYEVRPHRNR